MFNSYYEKHLFNLPKTWTIVRFGDIVSIRRGASPRPIKEHLTTREDGINWIKIGDTRPGDIYITETKQKILKESAALSVYLEKGTLVLSNSMSFGRPYILNIDGCIHDGWLAIEIYNNTIDKEFLQIILQGYMWYFKNKATGTGVDNLNINRVQEMPFALPPLAEQRRILFALRSYHKLLSEISDSYCAINKTVSLVKYKILDLFFGKNSRYKSYYGKRTKTTLEKLIPNEKIGDGDWVLSEDMNPNGDIQLLQLKHIGNMVYQNKSFCHIDENFFKEHNCSEIKENYLLINRLVASSMACCLMPQTNTKTITSVDVCWIAPDENYNSKYIMYYLSSKNFQNKVLMLCSGSTRKRISKKNLTRIPLFIHDRMQQDIIVNRIENLFELVEKVIG